MVFSCSFLDLGIELYFVGLETLGGCPNVVCPSSATCEEIQYVQGWQHELRIVYVFSKCVLLFGMHPNVCVLLVIRY